jgi:beta-xylosidase
LFADYSDPDCTRVGGDYYLVCSEFHFMGMPLLHSRDLVNWTIINRIYDRFLPGSGYDGMCMYGKGSWAPSIRYHDGTFYVYFCTPTEGLFMCKASDPCGAWSEPLCVSPTPGWEDPCPFWDSDGKAYLGRSRVGAGSIILHRLSPDGTSLLDGGVEIYTGPVAEGTKFYFMNGYYYLIIPEGGVASGWQTALRSRSIYGPYERKIILSQGKTWVNGPHQGALVDTPGGELWFIHFSSTGVAGRVVHLQPARLVGGWPAIIGPLMRYKKPALPSQPISAPKTSDFFDSCSLGFQWQWNHNPIAESWSLAEHPGWLRLKSKPVEGDALKIPNILTQRLTGACGLIRVRLDASGMSEGQSAGLILLGRCSFSFGALKTGGRLCIIAGRDNKPGEPVSDAFTGQEITLQLSIQYFTEVHAAYRVEGGAFIEACFGENLLSAGVWKGCRIGLYTRDGWRFRRFCRFRVPVRRALAAACNSRKYERIDIS